MGCGSSTQVDQNGDKEVRNKPKDDTKVNSPLNDSSSSTKDKKGHCESAKNDNSPHCNGTMENNNNIKTNEKNARNAQEHLQNGSTKLSITEPKEEIENDTEENDTFDMSIKPVSEYTKEHPTQETLKFIYEHSMSSSPNHTGGGFPAFSTEGFASPVTGRSYSNRRRPSGVPPPPRELKPGDFLYQKALKARGSLSMAEEDEES